MKCCWLIFFCAMALPSVLASPGRVRVLDDFESADSIRNWKGDVRLAADTASHGRGSALVRFKQRGAEVSFTPLQSDWRGYERLCFDVHSEQKEVLAATLRIFDDSGGTDAPGHYEADAKILLLAGWNHVVVKLNGLHVTSYERPLALARIRKITLSVAWGPLPCTLHLDNLRLVAGEEGKETATRTQPFDALIVLEDRFFKVRQVAAWEDVPEASDVARLHREAQAESVRLSQAIHAAQTQGIETIYADRHLVTADLGLRIRPQLAWFNNDAAKREMFAYVASSCRQARLHLDRMIQGLDRLPAMDDTQIGEPLIPPFPPLKGRPIRDGFFRDERGEPLFVISVHSPSRLLEHFFASPQQHIESYSGGGGSRWTIDESPVYDAFQADPATHRVGWDGWCGHLVRDLSSMGTSKPENTVICLESPRIRAAIEEYIRLNIPKFHRNPELLYDIMGYELMYICYCDRSQRRFREWIEKKHGTIAQANQKWGTFYRQFSEVIAPPVRGAAPLPGTNRGLWYDWARFNQDRFTEHLLWVRSVIRQLDVSVPLAAGGSSYMLSGTAGASGIDEERIVNEVDDLIIHEGGDSTMGMDLQLALSESKKPLADPEMNLAGANFLMPHLLHGKSVVQLWHWPAQPGDEFYSSTENSFAHGWRYSLADVGELLRVSLDARRLNKEIAAFGEAPAQVAILYSQTATLQLPPEMLTWKTTPYLAELNKTYESSRCLDAKVTFVTERQIQKGWLARYKVLLVPAVRNLPIDVVERIWQFASQGGRVLVLPESLAGDEYNRPASYLDRLGIRIQTVQYPKTSAGDGVVQGYDQSLSRHITYLDAHRITLNPTSGSWANVVGELQTQGIHQTVSAEAGTEVVYRYPDGSPAVLRIALGRGEIYFSATSIEERGFGRLLDYLFSEAGVDRPIRIRPVDSSGYSGVEARFAPTGRRKLLYVVNYQSRPVRLQVEVSWPLRQLRELRDGLDVDGNLITIPARQTAIYELLED